MPFIVIHEHIALDVYRFVLISSCQVCLKTRKSCKMVMRNGKFMYICRGCRESGEHCYKFYLAGSK